MRHLVLSWVLMLVAAPLPVWADQPTSSATSSVVSAIPMRIKAADGSQVFADFYKNANPKALILLFHQAGSNKGEYREIAPRLVAAGYSALAIDQRSGGNYLGGINETVKARGRSAPMEEGYADMEAALAWAKAQRLPIYVWGSSYSATLVFSLSAKHSADVKAVLAFSPGNYFDAIDVYAQAKRTEVPVFITQAKKHEEIDEAAKILAAVASKTKIQFVPKAGGVHGSSTLIASKNPKGATENWDAAMKFLAALK